MLSPFIVIAGAVTAAALSGRQQGLMPLTGGSFVALPTPMQADGSLDDGALRAMLEWHIEAGTAGIVALGTTGEASTLSADERDAVLRTTVDVCKDRLPIIAGTGTISTEMAIAQGRRAQDLGVDATLVVTPYYVKPPPAGLIAHFTKIADAVDVPMILYNVPSRTGVDMKPETVGMLSDHDNIVGIKEATGKTDRVAELRASCGEDFLLYSGDDGTCLDFCFKGGDGVISVTAAVAPRQMQAMIEGAQLDAASAQVIDGTLRNLHSDLFCQANPIPVKWALHRAGRMGLGIRLPLVQLDAEYHALVEDAMRAADAL